MNKKYEHKYINSVVAKSEPKYDWVITKLHIRAAEFVDFLKALLRILASITLDTQK